MVMVVIGITFFPQRALNIMLPFLHDSGSFRLLRYSAGTQSLRAGQVKGMVVFAPTLNDITAPVF